MSDFTAIAAVTGTLRRLLESEMVGITIEDDISPANAEPTLPTVALFLYRVDSNAFTANLDWAVRSATQLQAPPFGLNLHYLVTPYGPGQIEIQRTLGEVMRVFHDRAVLRAGDPALLPPLAAMTEELRIVPRTLSLSDSMELWKSFHERSYRLSLTYEVSAVLIDSAITRDVERVQERVLDLAPLR